ncbi:MAG TPA: CRTAC1 family protein, partial [Armatimonadota bacterium]|nr:CRTAC1 family protein [Armatimonadota bacterium]
GCAFLDYDADGWPDLVFAGEGRCALYRNAGNGAFTDVTADSGLPRSGRWVGVAAADYDNDGYPDLLLNGFGCLRLLHNRGGRGFEDVTRAMGLDPSAVLPGGAPAFGTSAAWGDFDRDGWLDLYVCRYVAFPPGAEAFCRSQSGHLQTCNPDRYAPQRGLLYRSDRGRRFLDVTARLGADQAHGKAWGALFFDADGDGWPDLYVANDEEPGDLLHNRSGRGFRNVGAAAGVAYDADGRVHGAMGVDAGDFNADGRPDLVVTTFVNEPYCLYRGNDGATFTETALTAGLAQPTRPYVGWGTKLFDFDNDGWLDLLFVNGHATDSDLRPDARRDMAQPLQLFRNSAGAFTPVPLGPLSAPLVGRGAAFGDYDNDGFPDVAVVDLEGPALLLHNEQRPTPSRHWLGLTLRGRRSNRQGLGARVTLRAGARTRVAEAGTGGSVLSSNDPRLCFGLGDVGQVDEITIQWPAGGKQRLLNPPIDRYLEVVEGAHP